MKRLKLNRWLISIITLAMVYLVFQPEKPDELTPIESQIHDSDYYMKNVTIDQFSPNGKLVNQLTAKRLEHWNNEDISLLDKPVIVFGKNKDNDWVLNAKKGEITSNNSIILLEEKVTISEQRLNNIKTKMMTEKLTIDLEKNIAYTDNDILIDSQYYTTRSLGLEINLDTDIINLKNNVETEIRK